jgi:putative colanic acid biosynthesis acetyltransferase WcaF
MVNSYSNLKYQDDLGFKNKFLRGVWGLVWFFFARANPRIGFNCWRIFILRLFGAKIGKGCKVAASCRVWAPWNLKMGDFSVLGDDVDCYCMNIIEIGSKVAVSQGAYDITSLRRPLITKPIKICDHAWICSRAVVYPGVTIHEGAVVAAAAVVIKDVQCWSIVGGNPAIFIKRRTIRVNV